MFRNGVGGATTVTSTIPHLLLSVKPILPSVSKQLERHRIEDTAYNFMLKLEVDIDADKIFCHNDMQTFNCIDDFADPEPSYPLLHNAISIETGEKWKQPRHC